MRSLKDFGNVHLLVIGSFSLFAQVSCGLQPYYLDFPPPVLTVPNGIEGDFSYSAWPHRQNGTLTRGGNFPSGPIPLILHTWVKPDNSEGTRLQNGTVIYYLGGPWGGIRTSSPSGLTAKPQSQVTPVSNSLSDQKLSSSPAPGGYSSPIVDITTPPPTRQQTGPWGHGHLGFGWPSSTQLYDDIPVTTTASIPTRSQLVNGTSGTTTIATTTSSEAGTTVRTSTTTNGTTTVDPIAENTNARFPVSDSVRKFRRIVAQIRAITKKELGAESREARREQRRRERLLRNRASKNY